MKHINRIYVHVVYVCLPAVQKLLPGPLDEPTAGQRIIAGLVKLAELLSQFM